MHKFKLNFPSINFLFLFSFFFIRSQCIPRCFGRRVIFYSSIQSKNRNIRAIRKYSLLVEKIDSNIIYSAYWNQNLKHIIQKRNYIHLVLNLLRKLDELIEKFDTSKIYKKLFTISDYHNHKKVFIISYKDRFE